MSNARQPQPDNKPRIDLPGFGVKALYRLGKKAIEELEGPWKLLVILPFCGSILAIVLEGIFVGAGQPYLAFWLCLMAFVQLVIAVPFFLQCCYPLSRGATGVSNGRGATSKAGETDQTDLVAAPPEASIGSR